MATAATGPPSCIPKGLSALYPKYLKSSGVTNEDNPITIFITRPWAPKNIPSLLWPVSFPSNSAISAIIAFGMTNITERGIPASITITKAKL